MYLEFLYDVAPENASRPQLKSFEVHERDVKGQTWEEIPLFEFLRIKQDRWFEYWRSSSPYADIASHADQGELDYIHGSQETEIAEVLRHLFPTSRTDFLKSRLQYVECFG